MELSIGEQVYVLGKGYGRVRLITDGGFDVDVQGHGVIHFNPDGTQGVSNEKRVFYDNPVVVAPIADERLWRFYIRTTRFMFEELRALEASGFFREID